MTTSTRIIAVIELIWDNASNPLRWSCVATQAHEPRYAMRYFSKYVLSRDEHRLTVICYNKDCGIELAKEAAAAYLDFKQGGAGKWTLGQWKLVDLND